MTDKDELDWGLDLDEEEGEVAKAPPKPSAASPPTIPHDVAAAAAEPPLEYVPKHQ